MTPAAGQGGPIHDFDALSGRQVAGWTAAGATVLALHAGVAAWVLRSHPAPPAEAAVAAAVMIELAPETVAPDAVEDQISDALRDLAPTDTPALDLPTPERNPEVAEVPDRVAEPEPDPVPETTMTQAAPLPEPVGESVEPEIATAVAPLPRKRAELQKVTDAIETPNKNPAEPPGKTAAPPHATAARVRAKTAPVAAAAQSNTGSGPSVSPAKWQARLLAHLERRKRYPAAARKRGDEGIAWVRFAVDAGGNVRSVSLAKSSGVPALDAEVVAMVHRASPVPRPPPDFILELTVPVNFTIR